ncbi:MAG: low molecular weight phosphotyrosine protein phosphatase [Firmicutes bacterium]|nr:low molecular weight phosphotyrosine protein phosphatase [Bacillota bacterium]
MFRSMVGEAGLADRILIDSAGTDDWHAGEGPHRGTLEALARHGIPAAGLTSRPLEDADYRSWDYILVMDADHLAYVRSHNPGDRAVVKRVLDFHPSQAGGDVPDPYLTGRFEEVYLLLEPALRQFLKTLQQSAE